MLLFLFQFDNVRQLIAASTQLRERAWADVTRSHAEVMSRDNAAGHVTLDTRPSRFSACNIEKLRDRAWGRG